ncbi:Mov34/MPN/PAD-1 family protein [Novosphingobium aerophilum]|uniref:Mov34/MPN/PAD-1 family protein n=1 Tax=Novosphingobium aerophilum TaxID=2839843 RepID=UPI0031451FB2
MSGVTLSATALAAMCRAAAAAAPAEACGLLLGEGRHVRTAPVTANVAPESLTRFEIDPAALIAAHRAARQGGPQVLGYWHSHPNGLVRPSPTDRAMACGDGRIWAIVASGAVNLWEDGLDGFAPLPYSVHEG